MPGFYYSANSLKAKFTKDGNKALVTYCKKKGIRLNQTGKVVVTSNENELNTLYELEKRAIDNGVDVKLITEEELTLLDSNIKTYQKALYSPNTTTVDPVEVCQQLKHDLLKAGVLFYFEEGYIKKQNKNKILTKNYIFISHKIVNCAGLYADNIAKDFGFSSQYIIIPFKGIYLKYEESATPIIKLNVYPAPNIRNPFLGVHYTIAVDGTIKIGPTAIPAFWRENYHKLDNFNLRELFEIIKYEIKFFTYNSFNFRALFFEETKKYNKKYLIGLAEKMLNDIDITKFKNWTTPGIRAQLLNTETLELVQDFVIEGDENSIHILNAVSPAFTCSFPFSKWIVDTYVN